MTTPTSPLPSPVGAVTVSSTELLACWEAHRLGEAPALLRLRRPGLTGADRHRTNHLFDTALADLARRGLADATGAAEGLAQMLSVIAEADYHLDLRYNPPHQPTHTYLAIAAVTTHRAVAVLRNEAAGTFQLWPVTPALAAPTLLGLLGNTRAGRGSSVNIPTDLLDTAIRVTDTAHGTPWDLADELQARGIPGCEATELAHMLTGAVSGGQLGATARHHGLERRGPWTIGFHRDRHGGCYMQLRRNGTLTIAPANARSLHQHWNTLINHLPHHTD